MTGKMTLDELMRAEALSAVDTVNRWLDPDGLSASCRFEKCDGCLGYYERDSVFTKEIEIAVDTDRIHSEAVDDGIAFDDMLEEVRKTVFHETGHALVNQIIDWTENIDTVGRLADGPFGEKYFDVFDDANVTEEELVEEFADGFLTGDGSPLQQCWEELRPVIESC